MKRILVMLLALGMLVSLAACGGSSTAPAPAPDPTPAASGDAPAPAPAGDKTVVYWSMWESTEPQGQAIQMAVEAFTAQTGIKVDLQFKGRTGIREGLQPALDGNQVIDLFDEDIDRVNTTFAPYLLDLEELSAKYDYEKTALPGFINSCREVGKGKLMSIPYQPNIFTIFYNQEIFDKAGVTTAPTTWAEFLDVCEKVKAAGYVPITCDDAYIDSMIGYHLGRLVGHEAVRDIVMNGKWDDPAVLQFAKDYEELASKGYFSPNITGNVWPAGQNTELAVGTAAMYLNGSWLPNEVISITGEDFVWGCFNYPTLPGGKVGQEAANLGAQTFGINKKSVVADEAFQLICFLTKGEWDQKLSQMSVGIPADTTNTEWPALMASVQPAMAQVTLRWPWAVDTEANNDMTAFVRDNTLRLCGGSITAEQFVQEMLKAAGK